ncbi:MAG: hypothetical protein M0R77_00965 [Gammaproteobacteria bacterium]|nr:hypothetical protein [Acholeplasmataceae bacterium]MCK9529126.1 hypothetical protein [Gammaproteobacteria bacterium]
MTNEFVEVQFDITGRIRQKVRLTDPNMTLVEFETGLKTGDILPSICYGSTDSESHYVQFRKDGEVSDSFVIVIVGVVEATDVDSDTEYSQFDVEVI